METISLPQSELLKFSLKIGAIKLFIDGIRLENNRIYPYLFNSRFFNNGDSIEILTNAYVDLIIEMNLKFDSIFNYFDNGIPSLAIAQRYYELTSKVVNSIHAQRGLNYHFINKGPNFSEEVTTLKDQRVLIVDDLLTEHCYEAVENIKMLEGTPVGSIICFDGQERVKDSNLSAIEHFAEKTGLPSLSVFNLQGLKDVLKDYPTGTIERYMFQKIIIYEKEYCVKKQ